MGAIGASLFPLIAFDLLNLPFISKRFKASVRLR